MEPGNAKPRQQSRADDSRKKGSRSLGNAETLARGIHISSQVKSGIAGEKEGSLQKFDSSQRTDDGPCFGNQTTISRVSETSLLMRGYNVKPPRTESFKSMNLRALPKDLITLGPQHDIRSVGYLAYPYLSRYFKLPHSGRASRHL
jgi:hypothetical protein